jgi:hypothetical protein
MKLSVRLNVIVALCHDAECLLPTVVILIVFMLRVIMLGVIMPLY